MSHCVTALLIKPEERSIPEVRGIVDLVRHTVSEDTEAAQRLQDMVARRGWISMVAVFVANACGRSVRGGVAANA